MKSRELTAMFGVSVVMVALLTFVLGATPAPEAGVGRFQISSTGTSAYVVDTVTGQVWSNGGDGFFDKKVGLAGPK